MKRIIGVTCSFLLVLSSIVFAGEHKKCTKTVTDCLNSMVEELKNTGFIGVELDQKDGKMRISKVIEGSPAEKAGFQIGDELYAINGIRFSKENTKSIRKFKVPGKKVTCTIKRDGASKQFTLTLVPMPADLMAKYIGEHMMQHAQQDKEAMANK